MSKTRYTTHISRLLRGNQTDAETKFWHAVKAKRLHGLKFRRQFPVGPYYVDFACVEALLIVEIDGGQHNENPKDAARDAYLNDMGYKVIRYWNNDVLENLDGVLTALLLHFPLSLRERAGERGNLNEAELHVPQPPLPLPDPLPEGEGAESKFS